MQKISAKFFSCLFEPPLGSSTKNPNRRKGGWNGVEDILFENPPGIFHFLTLLLEIPDKTKLNPAGYSTNLC